MSQLDIQSHGQVTIIRFGGALTGPEVREIEPQFNQVAMVPGKRLVIDLAGVEMLNTPALTVFVSAAMFQRPRKGKVVFTGVEGVVERLLRVCRLDTVLHVVKDKQAAIEEAGR
jgi:anti-anti-sigma factor